MVGPKRKWYIFPVLKGKFVNPSIFQETLWMKGSEKEFWKIRKKGKKRNEFSIISRVEAKVMIIFSKYIENI